MSAFRTKMVPFYGTVYKSILYDLIIAFPRGRNGKNDVRLFLCPGRPEKANNLIINSLWIVFYAEWHQLPKYVIFCQKCRLIKALPQWVI
jgi:hypothetical protein